MKTLLGIILVSVTAVLAGCHSGQGSCPGGSTCDCHDGTDCYQGCADGDDCTLSCHNLNHCGGVCENHCNLIGHDVIDFSADCGSDCNITCHNTTSCGAFCGPGCTYDCYSVDRCGVRAGNSSHITCSNVTSCVVECTGSCHVDCRDTVGRCDVTCPGGGSPTSCANGLLACGSC